MEREIARFNLICESALSVRPLRLLRPSVGISGSMGQIEVVGGPGRSPLPLSSSPWDVQPRDREVEEDGREGEETADVAEEVSRSPSHRMEMGP